MGNCCRACVSKEKRHIVIPAAGVDSASGLKSANGCDLDMSLVHARIVAMGFPSVGVESCYRNPRDDVVELLEENFGTKYRVYNVCSEADRQYDAAIFSGRVFSEVQWPDHLPPTLAMLQRLVDDAVAYLAADAANVVIVHCKAGKGRTGVIVTSLLVATAACATADEAIDKYAVARTKNSKGLTIPSQKRYVRYFAEQQRRLRAGIVADAARSRAVCLTHVGVRGFAFMHVLPRDPTNGALLRDRLRTCALRETAPCARTGQDGDSDGQDDDARGALYSLGPNETGHGAITLQADFCLCFSHSNEFPCAGVMVWLHSDFVAADDGAPLTFKAAELDSWKSFWGSTPDQLVLSLGFVAPAAASNEPEVE